MPILGEQNHEIRIFRMQTKAGLEYVVQAERPSRVLSFTVKGVTLPLAPEDVVDLQDAMSRAGLWQANLGDNPLVPRV